MRQRTVSDYFWRDPAICDLSQEDKATLLYFLTSPFSNIIGVYQIVWAVAAAEMGWTKDQMTTVAKRLQFKGLMDMGKNMVESQFCARRFLTKIA
jgi:ATP-dependent protease Clp ATPase subunit